jgi:hypothetical protein
MRTFTAPRGRSSSGLPIPERVYGFLVRHTPQPICDDCVAKNTETSSQTIEPLTVSLSLTTDFDKEQGICHLCKTGKPVTRSLRYA